MTKEDEKILEEKNIEWALKELEHWIREDPRDRTFAAQFGYIILKHIEQLQSKLEEYEEVMEKAKVINDCWATFTIEKNYALIRKVYLMDLRKAIEKLKEGE